MPLLPQWLSLPAHNKISLWRSDTAPPGTAHRRYGTASVSVSIPCFIRLSKINFPPVAGPLYVDSPGQSICYHCLFLHSAASLLQKLHKLLFVLHSGSDHGTHFYLRTLMTLLITT